LKRDRFLFLLCERDRSGYAKSLICDPNEKVTQYFWARLVTKLSKSTDLSDGVYAKGNFNLNNNYVARAMQARCGHVYPSQEVFHQQISVRLEGCEIMSLPSDGLGEFPQAKMLDLSRNHLTELGTVGKFPQLETLDLRYNKLTDMNYKTIRNILNFKNLKYLYMSHNPMTVSNSRRIANNLAKQLPQLQVYFTAEGGKTKLLRGTQIPKKQSTPSNETKSVNSTEPIQQRGSGLRTASNTSQYFTDDDGYFEY